VANGCVYVCVCVRGWGGGLGWGEFERVGLQVKYSTVCSLFGSLAGLLAVVYTIYKKLRYRIL